MAKFTRDGVEFECLQVGEDQEVEVGDDLELAEAGDWLIGQGPRDALQVCEIVDNETFQKEFKLV